MDGDAHRVDPLTHEVEPGRGECGTNHGQVAGEEAARAGKIRRRSAAQLELTAGLIGDEAAGRESPVADRLLYRGDLDVPRGVVE